MNAEQIEATGRDLIELAPTLNDLLELQAPVLAHEGPSAKALQQLFRERRRVLKKARDDAENAVIAAVGERLTGLLDPEGFPDTRIKRNKDGEITGVSLLSTVENLAHLCDGYGIVVRYNEMTKSEEILLPGTNFSSDNAANAALAVITSICRRNALPILDLLPYVCLLAEKNKYHPVRDWIASKPWDGMPRLQALFDTLAVKPEYEEHRDSVLRRWLLSTVAAAFSTDQQDSFHGVLTLVGDQGIGKTSWIRRLAAEVTGAVKGGALLNPSNKDSVLEAVKHWVVELGELDGNYRKVDINELKGWLTKADDELRQVFAKRHSLFKRRTVFAATVNDDKFLVDATGNRRWWTIPVLSIDYQHTLDMQQVLAEVYELYADGEQWHLTKAEEAVLNRLNAKHEVVRPMEELLESFFVFDSTPANDADVFGLNPTLISRFLGLKFEGNQVKLNDMGKAIRKLTGQNEPASCRGVDGKPLKGWKLVPRDPSLFTSQNRT